MDEQSLDHRDRVAARCARLKPEPFVDHQPVAAIARVKIAQRRLAFGGVEHRQHRQRALPVGHIVGRLILRLGQCRAVCRIARRDQRQSDRLQPSHPLGRTRQIAPRRVPALRLAKFTRQRGTDRLTQRLATDVDRIGIDHCHAVADQRLRRHGQRLALIRRIERVRGERVAHRRDHRPKLDRLDRLARCPRDQRGEHQFLKRLVARERVAIALRQSRKLARLALDRHDHRRRKTAIDRQQGRFVHPLEDHRLRRFLKQHQPLGRNLAPAAGPDQRGDERDRHRLLVGLAGGRRDALGQMQGRGPRRGIMHQPRLDFWRPRLPVPVLEPRQILPAGILHRCHEIVAGRSLAVVTGEVQIGTGAERLCPQHRAHHADQLGTLVIYRRGVEIGDLEIIVGPHRVRQRAAILGELRRAEQSHIVDPLDRRRADVGREALVAKHGEAFFQAQLEPVAAGHPIARPIVEIFVRDDSGDGIEVGVGRGILVGQHITRVKDVEAFILHRPEVEILDRDDVEQVEIIFAAISRLVPRHRLLQAGHSVRGLGQIALAHPDRQIDRPPAHRHEG